MAISPEIHFWAGLEAQRLIVGYLGMGVLLVPFFNKPRRNEEQEERIGIIRWKVKEII
ncbi:MAG: hypothetical protein ACKPDM_09730 [Dolichospermum sp.]